MIAKFLVPTQNIVDLPGNRLVVPSFSITNGLCRALATVVIEPFPHIYPGGIIHPEGKTQRKCCLGIRRGVDHVPVIEPVVPRRVYIRVATV